MHTCIQLYSTHALQDFDQQLHMRGDSETRASFLFHFQGLISFKL